MQRTLLPNRRPRNHGSRTAAAVMELAVCLPLILLLTFGSIEAANSIYLKQTLATAAYEAARVATGPGGVEADGRLRCQQVLAAHNVQKASVEFSPSQSGNVPRGTAVTVTVTAPSNSNSVGPQWYSKTATLRAVVVMPRL